MTNKEAVIAVAGVEVPDNVLAKALLDLGLSATDDYQLSNAGPVDLATMSVLKSIIATADITEGGYSIKYDRSAILKLITSLGIKNGLPEYMPLGRNVRAISVW